MPIEHSQITMRADGSAEFFSANRPAWHGTGRTTIGAQTAEQALIAAQLNWIVEKRQAGYLTTAGDAERPRSRAWAAVKAEYFTVRTDTGRALGRVGESFAVLQNAEAFDALSIVLQEHGLLYETAGSLRGGEHVWLLARHPGEHALAGDEVRRYVLLSHGHDGRSSIRILETIIRVVCRNTLSRALGSAGAGVRITHSGNLAKRIVEAQQAFSAATASFEVAQKNAEKLAQFRPSRELIDDVIEAALDAQLGPLRRAESGAGLLDAVLDVTEKKAALARAMGKRTEAKKKINAALRRELKAAGAELANGWLLQNAISEWADQTKNYRGDAEVKAERRFEEILYGRTEDTKAEVVRTLLHAA